MQYRPVDIATFRNATRDITFDVYLKLSEENMAHVFSKATGLDYQRLAQYIQKGVKELYIRNEDYAAYEAFLARPAQSVFSDPSVSPEKKIATLLNMTEQNMAELFAQINIAEDTASNSKKLVKSYVNLMGASPKTLSMILKLASHGDYLYYHSISVSIFSMILAKATGLFDERTLELIGMGGLLHDIGSTQLPKEIVSSHEELTASQWKEMHTHTKLGLQMIENTPNIPDEVRYIVYQHHEQPGGHGYPNGLRGDVIYFPAKIVRLADAFSALISKRSFRPAYSVDQAIEIIHQETEKFDPDLVRILVSIFQRKANSQAA